jgi:hypothetical protein
VEPSGLDVQGGLGLYEALLEQGARLTDPGLVEVELGEELVHGPGGVLGALFVGVGDVEVGVFGDPPLLALLADGVVGEAHGLVDADDLVEGLAPGQVGLVGELPRFAEDRERLTHRIEPAPHQGGVLGAL